MSLIVRYRESPRARFAVVCIPHAGGAVSEFRQWPQLFPEEFEVNVVELPGHGRRLLEPLMYVLTDIADVVAAAVAQLPARPLILFGHSMGALVAFEVSRRLQAPADNPLCLCVSGSAGPQVHRSSEKLHELSKAAFIRRIAQLTACDEQPPIDPELVNLFEPALRADYAAAETYRYEGGGNVNVPVAAFGGDRDATVSLQDLRKWAEVTQGPCIVRLLRGGHFYLRREAPALVDQIVRFCGWMH